MTLRRTYVTALGILVAVFVALYPYLDAAGYCISGGCPEVSQSSHTASAGFSATCLVAMLAVAPAAFAFVSFFGRRRAANHSRPDDLYLAPDPRPPRVSL